MQAQCPSCGSSIPFKSQLSAYAVCSACQTLVVRKDVSVESVGTVAALQPDGSLLQVGTQGNFRGNAFEILGRIQIAIGPAVQPLVIWNEWYASFANGVNGWIGEALGEYFVSFLEAAPAALPAENQLQFGQLIGLDKTRYAVTSIAEGTALGFEGELPFVMSTEYTATMVDLSSCSGLSASIDYSETPPLLFRGQWCSFADLKFTRLREGEDDSGPRLSERNLKSLKCASCGAPHELRAGGLTQTLVCQFCDAVMDLNQDATFKEVLNFQQAQARVPAVIPLGSEGKLPGLETPVRCIGYMRRSCLVEGVRYAWSEYLLYEPTVGYRWLTEARGHWTLLRPLHKVPSRPGGDNPVGIPPTSEIVLDGQTFKHFQKTRATVDYVAGEFYWRVRVGESSLVDDYVAPPRLLSADVGAQEVNWSEGVYLKGEEVWRAFSLPGTVLSAQGVANNQPNPHGAAVARRWKTYVLALFACFVFLLFRSATQPGMFFEQSWTYKKDEPEHSKLANITVPPGTHNLRITVSASGLNNRWAFFQLSLIDEQKRLAFDTGTTLYHETGMDEGEPWSETQLRNSVMLSQVPGGQYLLRVDPQSNVSHQTSPEMPTRGANPLLAAPVFNYSLKVERDVPQWGYFWMLLFLGMLPPLWSLWKRSSFETARWSESDHAPGGFSFGDDE